GSIYVGARPLDVNGTGQFCEISIRDTGIGIDPANHKIVFEKLYQLGKVELHSSGRTKFKGGGPGLGLAIAAGIVKAHKGKIWVESPGYDEEKLPGSTFFIEIPMAE
ncbi:MAG TPA: HAMP domain-containing sensor histidine kinase, partial [Anaerolineales bacterium]|nr:HAMP domain-containing sensor histidine kinase [Anaerolineales bacterium]